MLHRVCLTASMASSPSPTIPLFLFFVVTTTTTLALSEPRKPTDTDALTIFRATADAHNILASNWTTPDACSGHWLGVGCSFGRVTSLSLPSLDLRGPLTQLSHLDQLRLLDLHSNKLNGTISFLPPLNNLKLLYLSGNDLSGPIPPALGRLSRLVRIDLSGNSLSGSIPPELANLTRLHTFRVSNNLLSGPLPDLPHLTEFNASNNQLSGNIPTAMLTKFGQRSVAGNPGICGLSPPLPLCSTPPHQTVVQSTPSSMPSGTHNTTYTRADKRRRDTITGIIIGNGVFLLLLLSLFLAYCCCFTASLESNKAEQEDGESRGSQKGGRDSEESEGTKKKLVFFDSKRVNRRFELDELLRASAELVGKGSVGTVYRAALEDGRMAAVKRLRDAGAPYTRKQFHEYMEVIGQLTHPNLVPLWAYYFANEEKLLIYDFLPNGSLHTLLHENRGPGRKPLDWTTRISLVLGAARGLACIHECTTAPGIAHGSVKSSNVLLDKNGVARVSDFGLALLLSPVKAMMGLGGYRAPEVRSSGSKQPSQEADVYSFGVLLLEVLTGRVPTVYPSQSPPPPKKGGRGAGAVGLNLPEWVRSVVKEEWTSEVFDPELMRYKNVEEEMVGMLQVGLGCVTKRPEQRPKMAEVVRMIQDIRVEQSPLAEEDNDTSSQAATTEDGRLSYVTDC